MSKFSRFLVVVIPFIIFLVVISLNFFKPFGFFRESNPAMVCINANTWQRFPEVRGQHIPVSSYSFDPTTNPSSQLYSVITTFGYAWFSVPYYFFSIFHLQPGEVSLRVFSLLWFAFTLLTIYLLLKELTKTEAKRNIIIYLSLVFYVFNPVVLWYHVQGYVHEVAVLPFYFLGWLLFAKYIHQNSSKYLYLLAITLFIGVQFDWLPVFQAGLMSLYLLINRGRTRHKVAFLIPGVAMATGVAYIAYTYVQWATLPLYVGHLQEKFLKRTIGGGGLQLVPGINHNLNVFIFYVTGYGLLAVLFCYGLLRRQTKNPVVWLMVGAAVLHHFIFWGFSSEHDHGVVKMALPIAFVAAVILTRMSAGKIVFVATACVFVNIGFYFYLHNYYSRPGMYKNPNFMYDTGVAIRQINKEDVVFINTEGKYLTQLEFYAGRPYTMATSPAEAKEMMMQYFKGRKGYFVELEGGIIKAIDKLTP